MIADAPYHSGALILSARVGAGAGAAASVAMIGALALMFPRAGLLLPHTLARLGRLVMPHADRLEAVWAGLGTMVAVGTVCGLLYALAQQRMPLRGLTAVGLFYGILLWMVGGLLGGWVTGTAVRQVLHSWPWLLADVIYGLGLATAAIWAARRRPAHPTDVPVD